MTKSPTETVGAKLRRSIYGFLVVSVALCVAIACWAVLAVLPGIDRRWRFAHRVVRGFSRLIGIGLISDHDQLNSPSASVVYMANHGSFLDAIVLVGCFSSWVCFVAASEFEDKPVFGHLLRRLNVDFVHRDDPTKAVSDARRLANRLRLGDRLVIFPEGSLDPRKGVRTFLTGAFYAPARTSSMIIPIGIHGADDVLTPHHFFPRRGVIAVRFGQPVAPVGTKRPNLDALAEQVRQQIVELSGEPDLES